MIGECRRFPPQVIPPIGIRGKFPVVPTYWTCGEYLKKIAIDTESYLG